MPSVLISRSGSTKWLQREAAERGGSASPSKPLTNKRSRTKQDDNGGQSQEGEPVPKKTKAASKKAKLEGDEAISETGEKSKSKGRKKAGKVKLEEEEGPVTDEKPKRKDSRKVAKVKAEDTDDKDNLKPGPQPNTKGQKKATKVKAEDIDDEIAAVGAPKLDGRRRAPKAKPKPNTNGAVKEDYRSQETATQPPTKKARATRKAASNNIKSENTKMGEAAEGDADAVTDEPTHDTAKAGASAEQEGEANEEELLLRKGHKKAKKAAHNGTSSSDSKKANKAKVCPQQLVLHKTC